MGLGPDQPLTCGNNQAGPAPVTGDPPMTLDEIRVVIYDRGGCTASTKPYPQGRRRRTAPVASAAVPLIRARMTGKAPEDPLCNAPEGGSLSESNWRRAVGWSRATVSNAILRLDKLIGDEFTFVHHREGRRRPSLGGIAAGQRLADGAAYRNRTDDLRITSASL